MKALLRLILFPLCTATVSAQQPRTTAPLSVGDVVPYLVLNHILHYPTIRSSTAAFGNKLLLLDFMHTSCKSCLLALPRMDSLQKKYASQLQILLVTPEKMQVVSDFILHNKAGKRIRLPVVTGDSVLSATFPHQYIPHEVWIDKGVVKAITSSQYVNEKSVEEILAGNIIRWPQKRDVTTYDFTQPLLVFNPLNIPQESVPHLMGYTAFTGYMDGVGQRVKRVKDTAAASTQLSCINQGIVSLFKVAFGETLDYPPSHILLKVKDSARYIYNEASAYKAAWMRSHTFCYEAVFPSAAGEGEALNKMLADLQYYLGISAVKEKRRVACLVLRRLAPPASPSYTTDQQKVSVANFLYRLNQTHYTQPVINESGLLPGDGLRLSDLSWLSLDALRKELKQGGLDLAEEEREEEMIVLTDSN